MALTTSPFCGCIIAVPGEQPPPPGRVKIPRRAFGEGWFGAADQTCPDCHGTGERRRVESLPGFQIVDGSLAESKEVAHVLASGIVCPACHQPRLAAMSDGMHLRCFGCGNTEKAADMEPEAKPEPSPLRPPGAPFAEPAMRLGLLRARLAAVEAICREAGIDTAELDHPQMVEALADRLAEAEAERTRLRGQIRDARWALRDAEAGG